MKKNNQEKADSLISSLNLDQEDLRSNSSSHLHSLAPRTGSGELQGVHACHP